MGEEGRQENRRFNGYINVYTEKDWYPVKVYLNWEETFSYGEDSAGVYSDYVTDLVDYMYLSSGDEDRIREFLREMLPVVSPESRLTDQEIEELIQHVAGGQDYISIELNEKCSRESFGGIRKSDYSHFYGQIGDGGMEKDRLKENTILRDRYRIKKSSGSRRVRHHLFGGGRFAGAERRG